MGDGRVLYTEEIIGFMFICRLVSGDFDESSPCDFPYRNSADVAYNVELRTNLFAISATLRVRAMGAHTRYPIATLTI